MSRPASHISDEMQRALDALGAASYSDLARRLSTDDAPVSERTVRNWSVRGIPAWRLDQIAQRSGCRVAWLRDGSPPKTDGQAHAAREPAAGYEVNVSAVPLTPRERALLDNFRSLDEASKAALEQTGSLFAKQSGSKRRKHAV